MIIEIDADGGFGGIAAAALHKRIDVDAQTEPMRQKLNDAFGTRELQRLSTRDCGDCADRLTYRITLSFEGRRSRSFTLREDQIPPEMLDLIDRM
ncbi:protealysin inhibitor emfourin [Paracoccus methylarcula]|uniref:Uncharacterized protein n=1 Tax=Paracoccus methylarcula TaxID=72022 RepID=A0A422QX64_9RHOB|nr:protealysin inhibitor emfourin [Paracoccus methylarcula]RNF34513.1 hypothetical protein A7A09_011605 [Paracoccus methylarcula]